MPASNRFSVSRILAVTLGTIFMAGTQLVMPAASAAPPDNDDIGGAVEISTIPFTDVVDTSEATVALGDWCGAATVWYTFTPATSGSYDLTTTGSGYDTMLALLQGTTAENLNLIECNDDRSSTEASIRAELTAGTTYYIQAGTCCGGDVGSVGPGGFLHLNVTETEPPSIESVTWDGIRITGETSAILSGSIACSGAESVYVQGTVRQRSGLNIAQSGFSAGGECSSGEFAVTASLDFGTRVPLPKRATVIGYTSACDAFDCVSEEFATTVRVTRR